MIAVVGFGKGGVAQAQPERIEQAAKSEQKASYSFLRGLNAEQVSHRFGEPDQKKGSSFANESWFYGKSVLIFVDGQVVAWSNAGDLMGRENLAGIRQDETEKKEESKWPNAWTPPSSKEENGEALDEILEANR